MHISYVWSRAGTVLCISAVALACAVAPSAAASAAVSAQQQVQSVRLIHICHSSKGHGALANRLSGDIESALRHRRSVVGIRVDDPHLGIGCWLHADRHFYSASVVKATILAALLFKAHARHRGLTSAERSEAWAMITRSDNAAANDLWFDVGRYYLGRFLERARMRQTALPAPYEGWGLTRITAHDETLLLWLLMRPNHVLTAWARRYELRLMAHVVSYERWGVPAGAPASYTVHVKNGWANLPDLSASDQWTVNSIGGFTRRNSGLDYSIVVLTGHNGTTRAGGLDYGITTIERVAVRVNRDLT